MAEDDPDRKPRAFMMINVELDGDDVTRNSVRELAAVLHLEDKTVIAEFDVKIEPPPERVVDVRCMDEFWRNQPDAWDWVRADAVPPKEAMLQFSQFLQEHSATYSIRCAAAPASQDFPWLKEYYGRYAPEGASRLHWYCYCLTTMRKSYKHVHGLGDTESWNVRMTMQEDKPCTHRAIDIVHAQAVEFCNLRTALKSHATREQNERGKVVGEAVVAALSSAYAEALSSSQDDAASRISDKLEGVLRDIAVTQRGANGASSPAAAGGARRAAESWVEGVVGAALPMLTVVAAAAVVSAAIRVLGVDSTVP